MIIAGVDPGLIRTGYGVIETNNGAYTLLEGGVIRIERDQPLPRRLNEIFDSLTKILSEYSPSILILEDPYSKYKIPKIAILMAHVNGVVSLVAARRGVEVVTYTANQVKHALTGTGRATKLQVQRMVQALLHLSSIPEPPDVADALALTLAHLRILGRGKVV